MTRDVTKAMALAMGISGLLEQVRLAEITVALSVPLRYEQYLRKRVGVLGGSRRACAECVMYFTTLATHEGRQSRHAFVY